MQNNRIFLGEVLFVQVQRQPLKVGERIARVYDPQEIERVASLLVTSDGIVGIRENGESVLDSHHRAHPHSRNRGDNTISIGFTAHYARMRERYGDHLHDGIAGENIIVACDQALSEAGLAGVLILENPDGGVTRFTLGESIAPCNEFSHFVHQAAERLPAGELKATLQFLNKGTRGFTLSLGQTEEGHVMAGARLYLES